MTNFVVFVVVFLNLHGRAAFSACLLKLKNMFFIPLFVRASSQKVVFSELKGVSRNYKNAIIRGH